MFELSLFPFKHQYEFVNIQRGGSLCFRLPFIASRAAKSQSKTLFLTIFDLRSLIALTVLTVGKCRLPGVLIVAFTCPTHFSLLSYTIFLEKYWWGNREHMRGSRKFCQRGSNGEVPNKYHHKRVIIGPPTKRF